MKKNKAYKYRIYPNQAQQVLISKTFGCVRFIFNKMLGDRISYYKETGLSLKKFLKYDISSSIAISIGLSIPLGTI